MTQFCQISTNAQPKLTIAMSRQHATTLEDLSRANVREGIQAEEQVVPVSEWCEEEHKK